MTAFPRLISIPAAAKRLGLSKATVYAAAKRGELRVVQLTDERVRLTPEALRDWVRSKEHGGNEDVAFGPAGAILR